MARGTNSQSKGFNVTPTTDMTMLRIEDVDCSSTTNCALTPIDGQFLVANGKTGKDGFLTNNATTNLLYFTDLFTDEPSTGAGAGLAMVWLSGWRGDTGGQSTTVPVVRGALRFKTKLFNLFNTSALPSSNGYIEGAQLTVQCCAGTTFSGTTVDTNTRLILTPVRCVAADGAPIVTAADTYKGAGGGWAVGYVTRVVTDSLISGTAEIEVQLYDKPMLQLSAAV